LQEQEQSMVQQFNEQVDEVYADLLKKLEKPRPDLQEISQQYQEAAAKDFFHSKPGALVREKLTLGRAGKLRRGEKS
jgi:hypothetical protein